MFLQSKFKGITSNKRTVFPSVTAQVANLSVMNNNSIDTVQRISSMRCRNFKTLSSLGCSIENLNGFSGNFENVSGTSLWVYRLLGAFSAV